MDVPVSDRRADGGLPGHLHPHGHGADLRPDRLRVQFLQPAAAAHLGRHEQHDPHGGAALRLHGRHAGTLGPGRGSARHDGAVLRPAARRGGHLRGDRGRAAGGHHRHRRRHGGHDGAAVGPDHAAPRLQQGAGHRHGGRRRHPGPDHPAQHRARARGRHHRSPRRGPVHGRRAARSAAGRHLHRLHRRDHDHQTEPGAAHPQGGAGGFHAPQARPARRQGAAAAAVPHRGRAGLHVRRDRLPHRGGRGRRRRGGRPDRHSTASSPASSWTKS